MLLDFDPKHIVAPTKLHDVVRLMTSFHVVKDIGRRLGLHVACQRTFKLSLSVYKHTVLSPCFMELHQEFDIQ